MKISSQHPPPLLYNFWATSLLNDITFELYHFLAIFRSQIRSCFQSELFSCFRPWIFVSNIPPPLVYSFWWYHFWTIYHFWSISLLIYITFERYHFLATFLSQIRSCFQKRTFLMLRPWSLFPTSPLLLYIAFRLYNFWMISLLNDITLLVYNFRAISLLSL